MNRNSPPSLYQNIYALVAKIPPGRVASYGQLARMLERCSPRQVGYAMAATPSSAGIPWHRVVNSRGEISARSSGSGAARQRALLEAEGICFDLRGRIDFEHFGWRSATTESMESDP